MESKVCSKCGKEKPLTVEYFQLRNGSKDGFRNDCKVCKELYDKKRYNENQEKLKKQSRDYYIKNKEKLNQEKKEYYQINKEIFSERSKKYYDDNREKILKNVKNYKNNNPEIREKWLNDNSEHIRKYGRYYRQKRIKNDDVYKMRVQISKMVLATFKRMKWTKNNNTAEIIGCDIKTFKKYIESKFKEGMSWDNHGVYGWHYDHIIPISTAKNIEDLIKLNHYTNFQPLWAEDNLKKSDTISEEWGNN